jgi:hypothetical protein
LIEVFSKLFNTQNEGHQDLFFFYNAGAVKIRISANQTPYDNAGGFIGMIR